MTSHTNAVTSRATADTPRRRHDRRFVALLAGVLVLLYLETFLRLSDMLPPLVGEAMFALGLTIAVAGTGWFAWTAPPAQEDASRWVANPVPSPVAAAEQAVDVPTRRRVSRERDWRLRRRLLGLPTGA